MIAALGRSFLHALPPIQSGSCHRALPLRPHPTVPLQSLPHQASPVDAATAPPTAVMRALPGSRWVPGATTACMYASYAFWKHARSSKVSHRPPSTHVTRSPSYTARNSLIQ
ncbi:hypothetical protein HBI81_184710 [Parastagonospora nodorum]|nr:hypothetical protein HBH51_224630 [Parastagonospora nodorum]KAH3996268.1 hypothetical protein HBI10_161930 [Parastagonospora nodorum]KAH4019553.1 hypothetical protein HBI13_126290 [Parastagonospora nodorum]KAH4289740.1 hypothetical protein HBI02_204270 [Parastagonospora nodorum]KAH4322339.1 hypothetical protein HBI00_199230 [Parastagonospora nodorum]